MSLQAFIFGAMTVLFPIQDDGHHPWMRWKEGTRVAIKVGGAAPAETSFTLKGKDKAAGLITLTYVTKLVGKGEETLELPTLAGQACVHCSSEARKLGEEKLKVGDQEVDCLVFELKDPPDERKMWLLKDSLLPVKVIEKEGKLAGEDLTAVSLKEAVKVAGKDYECIRLEGAGFAAAGKIKYTKVRWISAAMPGWTVKETRKVTEGPKLDSDLQVTEVLIK